MVTSHATRTLAAIDWSMTDCEGDARDAFEFLQRAPDAEEQAAWLRIFTWLQAYAYTRCRIQAPPAEARRAFMDPDVQREIRRDAQRILREILI